MESALRTYSIAKASEELHVRVLQIAIWGSAALAVLTLFLTIVDDAPRRNPSANYLAAIIVLAISAGCAALCFRALRRIRSASVTVDDEGLWRSQVPREEGLVRWSSIKSVRTVVNWQRLELLGSQGEILIDLKYQLAGFDELRKLVLSKIPQRGYPQRYKKKQAWTAIVVAGFLLALAVNWYVAGPMWLALGLLGGVGFGIYDLLTSVTAITLWPDRLEVEYSGRKLLIQAVEIKAVVFAEVPDAGGVVPRLSIELTSGKIIKLKGLNIDELELHRELSAVAPRPSVQGR